MVLIWDIVIFCFGIGLLIKGADWLVDSAARMAKQFGVSNFVIGLTIVAIGTSLPELGAAVTASFYGNSELALGNIIGSNIANLALIGGLAALFVPIGLKRDLYNRDGAIMLGATVLFYIFCLDGVLTVFEGAVFLFLFLAYIFYFITTKRPYKKEFQFKRYLGDYKNPEKRQQFEESPRLVEDIKKAFSDNFKRFESGAKNFFEDLKISLRKNRNAIVFLLKQLSLFFIGVVCIFFGSNLMVDAAMRFPISQLLIGLLFVAIGTSIPELFVTISSLRKGIPQIMIGNLIGSNIANILLVGGFAAIVNPLKVPISAIRIDFVFLLLTGWLFLVFLRNDRKITIFEAVTLLLLYIAFVASVLGVRLGF